MTLEFIGEIDGVEFGVDQASGRDFAKLPGASAWRYLVGVEFDGLLIVSITTAPIRSLT